MTVASDQLLTVSKSPGVKAISGKMFACLLATVLLTSALPAKAQQVGKIYRIGFLSGGFPSPSHWTTTLRTQLRALGYVEGKNIAIESRFAENKPDRLPALADEWSGSKLTSSLRVVRMTPGPPRMRPRQFPSLWRGLASIRLR